MLALVVTRFGAVDGILVGLGLMAQVGAMLWLRTTLADDDTLSRFRRVMRLAHASAAGLGGYLLLRLIVS